MAALADNDLYALLEVPKTATTNEIKKAYFKKALTCHPDKCPDDPAATARFQALSRAHAVLSDPEKRQVFDEAGIVDDGADDSGGTAPGGGLWEDYFRSMFPAVTLEKVEAFAASYRGSDEERGHVLDAYAEGGGDMDHVIDGVMCALEEDRARFKAIVDAAIKSGEAQPLGADKAAAGGGGSPTEKQAAKKTKRGGAKDGGGARSGASSSGTSASSSGEPAAAPAEDKAAVAKAKRRAAAAAKEAIEAEALLAEITARQQARSGAPGGGGPSDLASLIRSRNGERAGNFDSWAAGLEAKYAKPKGKKGGK